MRASLRWSASTCRPPACGVDAAHDAASGLAALSRMKPDAVILDVMLPDLDGFEVCRRIRARSDVPVLMLTARGDDTDRIVGSSSGPTTTSPSPSTHVSSLRGCARSCAAAPACAPPDAT